MAQKENKKDLPLAQVYQLLEPGPVVLISTSCHEKSNIMTLSWHMMIEFEPPLVGFVMSDRNFTFDVLKETKECVINVPEAALAQTVVDIGNISGAKIDKFKRFYLTPQPALHVKAPMIAECFANIECKVIDMKMIDKYNLFILEAQKAWITTSRKRQRMLHHCGNGNFVVDGKKIKLDSKKK